MNASNDEQSVDASVGEATDSATKQEANTMDDVSFDDVFQKTSKEDGKVTGTHGFLSRLDENDKEVKFFEQPLSVRNSLRSRFPDDYGNLKEEEDITSIIDKRITETRSLENAKEKLQKLIDENPESIKSHGRKLRNAITEASNDGVSPVKQLSVALGYLAEQGIYINDKLFKELKEEGKKEGGQRINTQLGIGRQTTTKSDDAIKFESAMEEVGFKVR